MRLFWIFIFFIVLGTEVETFGFEEPIVRVRIEKKIKLLDLRGYAVSVQGREDNYRPVSIPAKGIQNILVKRVLINKKWNWLVEKDQRSKLYAQNLLSISGVDLRDEAKALPKRILLSGEGEYFDIIGALPLESYIVGVLASEMPLKWPIEALKAQAIATRSYTMATIQERRNRLVHLESGIQDQVFREVLGESNSDPYLNKAIQAVHDTKGVLLYDRATKRILKAYYHSDCGGKTSSSKSVWGTGNLVGGAEDQSCPNSNRAQWTFNIAKKALFQKLLGLYPSLRGKELSVQSLEIIKGRNELRAQELRLALSDGQKISLLADSFRALMGYGEMRSTLFEVQSDTSSFKFKGKGFGHGVGLCQWGTRNLANQNQDHHQILAHYFPTASEQ